MDHPDHFNRKLASRSIRLNSTAYGLLAIVTGVLIFSTLFFSAHTKDSNLPTPLILFNFILVVSIVLFLTELVLKHIFQNQKRFLETCVMAEGTILGFSEFLYGRVAQIQYQFNQSEHVALVQINDPLQQTGVSIRLLFQPTNPEIAYAYPLLGWQIKEGGQANLQKRALFEGAFNAATKIIQSIKQNLVDFGEATLAQCHKTLALGHQILALGKRTFSNAQMHLVVSLAGMRSNFKRAQSLWPKAIWSVPKLISLSPYIQKLKTRVRTSNTTGTKQPVSKIEIKKASPAPIARPSAKPIAVARVNPILTPIAMPTVAPIVVPTATPLPTPLPTPMPTPISIPIAMPILAETKEPSLSDALPIFIPEVTNPDWIQSLLEVPPVIETVTSVPLAITKELPPLPWLETLLDETEALLSENVIWIQSSTESAKKANSTWQNEIDKMREEKEAPLPTSLVWIQKSSEVPRKVRLAPKKKFSTSAQDWRAAKPQSLNRIQTASNRWQDLNTSSLVKIKTTSADLIKAMSSIAKRRKSLV